VNTLILSKEFHGDLIRFLNSSPEWKPVYSDKLGVVYVRTSTQ
jgi:hypothetical protein